MAMNTPRPAGSGPLLIYVASAYSAPTLAERLANVERSMDAGRRLMQDGHVPVMPLLNHWFHEWHSREYGWEIKYETYMAWSFTLLRRCDGLLFLQSSPGADRELALAQELGLTIWNHVNEVPRA